MQPDNIRLLRKGQKPTRHEYNGLVEFARANKPTHAENDWSALRRKTLMKTAVEIPAFSIFPLINNATSTDSTFNSCYTVEQYNPDHISSYIPGYFGTNGRNTIKANSKFLGYVIDSQWDSGIIVSDYTDGAKECGFADSSWQATIYAKGLELNGRAPMKNNAYYARKITTNPVDKYGWLITPDWNHHQTPSNSPVTAYVSELPAWDSNYVASGTGATLREEVYPILIDDSTDCECSGYYYPEGTLVRIGYDFADGKYRIKEAFVPDLEGWIESDMEGYSSSENAYIEVKIANDEKWNDSNKLHAFPSLLNIGSTIQEGTPVLCRWFHRLNKWVIIEAACAPDPDYTASSGGSASENEPGGT